MAVDADVDGNISGDLADEIEAINAIYGESTLRVTSSRSSDVVCLLDLNSRAFSLELCFPRSYPNDAPKATGIDPLWMSLWDFAKVQKTELDSALTEAFKPGQVCLFDTLKAMRATSSSQYANPTENANPGALSLALTNAWALMTPDEIDDLEKEQQCAACLDHYMAVDLANLHCKHSYCPDCLQRGFQACIDSKDRFTCCGNWVPVVFLNQFCIFPAQIMTRYTDFLEELGAIAPVYCSDRRCSHFIISAKRIKPGLDNVTCRHCEKKTCAHCYRPSHPGICQEDTVTNVLVEKLLKNGARYCPQCHHMVEKNGGCNHMTCRCGYKWCWKCKKQRDATGGDSCSC